MAKSRKLSKAARQRRKDINNARTRYNRQAQRFRNEAKNLGGRDAEILEKAATQLEARANALKGINVRKPSSITQEQKEFIADSKNYLVSNNRTDWARGETLGRLRLSGTTLGHRFFALTESLWSGATYGRRLDAIRHALSQNPDIVAKYGAAPNANQMIEIVESISDVSSDDDSALYDTNDLVIQRGMSRILLEYGN